MSKRSASILVVDDEQEIVRALQRGLIAHGYTVRTARSSEMRLRRWRRVGLTCRCLIYCCRG